MSRGNAVAVNLMAVQIHVKICCIQSINFLFFVFIVPYHEWSMSSTVCHVQPNRQKSAYFWRWRSVWERLLMTSYPHMYWARSSRIILSKHRLSGQSWDRKWKERPYVVRCFQRINFNIHINIIMNMHLYTVYMFQW